MPSSSFEDCFPAYKSYDETKYHMSSFPPSFFRRLKGLVTGQVTDASTLKGVCLHLAGIVHEEPTTNWGYDYLIRDLSSLIDTLGSKAFPKTMDFLFELATEYFDPPGVDELNDFLSEEKLGYRLIRIGGSYTSQLVWDLVENVESRTEDIENTTLAVKDICETTREHLEQARKQLEGATAERHFKDAVRDCMSAMETFVKTVSGQSDIKDAVKALKGDTRWGPQEIVKQGLSIWDRLHKFHPDIRHGSPSGPPLSKEEAQYWADTISTYIRYLVARKKTLGI